MTGAAARAPSGPEILQVLRERCAEVAAQAEHVRIDAARAAEYAGFILGKYEVITGHDENHFVTEDREKTVSYILALGSINFGSGRFKAAGIEYRDIAGGLKRAFERGEMDSPAQWAGVEAEDIRHLLFPRGGTESEEAERGRIAALFAHHLSETGRIVSERFGGRAMAVLEAAEGSAARLVEILAEWGSFRDVSFYKGIEVPFLKRAQLLAAHLELTGIPAFSDMGALTCFADNMVPHVLRCDGVLEYTPALAGKIEEGTLITAGSAEEVEMRACAIHAVELMRQAAPAGITATNIDHLLWNRGYEPKIYNKPSHKTETVWY